MPISKKQPNCPYGNAAKYVCVNSQCRKPGLICEKGQNSQSQCWLFHENCPKVKWQQVESFAKDNLLSRTPQFINMQDKIDNIFLRTLQKIQAQHEKFKIWAKTYGHSLETMKFIKVLLDRNYQQLTGDYMATMLPVLSSKQQRRVELPVIIQSEVHGVKSEIERVLEKISGLYLRSKKMDKPSIYSTTSNQSSQQYSVYGQGLSSNNSLGNGYQNIHHSQKEYTKEKEYPLPIVGNAIAPFNNSGQFRSKILESLAPIEPHFQGRVIKSAKLLYRATQQNFSIKRFHQLCDNVPDTLTLIHNQFGKKFGGYTPVAWTSDKKHWVADKSLKSFIFSVDMGEKFKLNLAQFAIASNPQRGPTFGCCDICIVDGSNKEKSNCEFPISYNNNGKYVRSQNTSTLFTGNPKGQFYLKQWQVYRLQLQ